MATANTAVLYELGSRIKATRVNRGKSLTRSEERRCRERVVVGGGGGGG